MKKISSKRSCSLLFFSVLFLSLLSGCGEESSDSSGQTSQKASNVKLIIVNERGAEILQGDVLVQDSNKKEVLKTTLDGNKPYKLIVAGGVDYPLLVTITPNAEVYGQDNIVLKAILGSPMAEKLRISLKSTSAVEYINSQLGGVLSKENISKASLATMTPDFRPARSYKGGMGKISGK
jgi:hypothetical protein